MGNPDISKLRIIDVINKDSRGECVSRRACFDPVILQLSSTTEKMAIDFANMIHPDQKIRIGSNVFHWCTRGGENPKVVLTKESHLTTPVDQWHFMVFLYGPTGCGKSVILNLVEAFHGGPNYVGSFDTGYIVFLYTILLNFC